MTYIYSSFYCAVCSSDAAGKKLDFRRQKERGQPGLTLENIEKPLIHFASPRPRKPLNCLKKLSPSPKTIEVFGKSPPVPYDRGGDREGDPFIQCPLPSSLLVTYSLNSK